jgi:hypothetical protein
MALPSACSWAAYLFTSEITGAGAITRSFQKKPSMPEDEVLEISQDTS